MPKHSPFATLIDQDGMAVIGRTLHDLRGIRYEDGEGGNGGSGGDGGDGGDRSGDAEGTLSAADAKALRAQADKRMQERNAARDEAKAFKELGLTPDEIKALIEARDKTDAPDEEKIRKAALRDAEAAAREKFSGKLRAAEVRAQAAGLGFASPSDALALIPADKLAAVDVSDDDEVDAGEIKKLLEQLKTDKPYLLKKTDTTADHQTAGIGATGSGNRPEVQPGTPRMAAAYADSSKK
jgi:DNA-binding transcriptional MerR regulator